MNKPVRIPARRNAAADAAAALLRQAQTEIEQQRPAEAERIARELLERRQKYPEALHLLGRALLAQQRPGEAVAPLEQAARLRTDAAIETDLAIALRDTGRLADARIWFERATTRQPPFAEAFMGLGMLLRSMRQHPEAEAIVKRGLDVAPSMPELSMVQGGLCLDRADTANAKVAFARALANAPGHPEALFGFGIALLNEGEFARAAERFRQVVARDAGHVRARLNLAYCLLELGQWDDGVACLRATVKLDRKSCAEVLRMVVSSGRGRFWLKRSAAAEFFGLDDVS
jgi:tetratricopeptide (TPR) repeat protein